MKYIFKAVAVVALFSMIACGKESSDERWLMWYDKPAEVFIETLVMGNGQQGAIIYGGVERERIDLNDMTLWSGEPVDVNVDTLAAKEGLSAVREALAKEDYAFRRPGAPLPRGWRCAPAQTNPYHTAALPAKTTAG